MGRVFEAQHVETGAQVAVKVLLATADAELKLRFQREGEAHARVDRHPNVLRVHSAGQEGPTSYLVMDLVRGGSLHERLKREHRLSQDEAATITRDLARGLAHVHAHGVLHRDLKPENVLFTQDGIPKIADFGIAKIAGSTLTQTGTLIGTPWFMSPEQAKAERDSVGPASDVYALGALLYMMLCGEPPFVGTSVLQVLAHVDAAPPPPLARRGVTVDPGLEAICLRCLAKAPSTRPGSATALADALHAWLEGPRSRRRPLLLTLASLLVAGAILAWAWGDARRPVGAESPGPARRSVPATPKAPKAPGTVSEPPSRAARLEGPLLSPLASLQLPSLTLHAAFASATEFVTVGVKTVTRWQVPKPGDSMPTVVHETPLPTGFPDAPRVVSIGGVVGLYSREGGLAWLHESGVATHERGVKASAAARNQGGSRFAVAHEKDQGFVFVYEPKLVQVTGRRLPLRHRSVAALAFSPLGDRLAVLEATTSAGLEDRTLDHELDGNHLRVFDLVSARLLHEYGELGLTGRAMAFYDRDTLAIGTGFGRLVLVTLSTGEQRFLGTPQGLLGVRAHSGSVRSLAADPTCARLFTISRGTEAGANGLRTWQRGERRDAISFSAEPQTVDLSPDGSLLLVATRAGEIELFRVSPP